MKVEVYSEQTLLDAVGLLETYGAVSYSDKFRFVKKVTDPDELVSLLEGAVKRNLEATVETV